MKNTYKGDYKYSNGLPMSDQFHDTLEMLYKYSLKQGNTQTKAEMFKQYEDLLMDTLKKIEGRKR